MRHPLLVEGRPNCARQSLASTLSAPCVAATSYCDPGCHSNVITPCLLTPCLKILRKIHPEIWLEKFPSDFCRSLFLRFCCHPLFAVPFWLSVLKRCVPKTLAFAFGLRLRSKTRCFKTRVSGRRLPNGKPQERLRFRALRSKTLALKERIAIIFCDLKTSLGARTCVQVLCVQKTRRFAFAFLSPLSLLDFAD